MSNLEKIHVFYDRVDNMIYLFDIETKASRNLNTKELFDIEHFFEDNR